jgi:membrane-associated protein
VLAKALVAAAGGAIGVLGGPAVFGVLTVVEAGIPFPIPADLVVLVLGARVANGDFPLWAAVVALELAAALGTTTLFLICRGPGRAAVRRLGGRVGLTPQRLQKASSTIERRGGPAIAIGRGTPGLRTLTVVATGGSGVSARRALPALLLGSTVFLQGHLVLGMVLGPVASDALDRARTPVLAALAVLIAGGLALWLIRRGRRGGLEAWTEACCPACLALGLAAAARQAMGGSAK